MSDTIRGNEIIEDGHLNDAIGQVKTLIEELKNLNKAYQDVAKASKASLSANKGQTAREIAQINAEVAESQKLRKNSVTINDQIIKQEERLTQALSQENKELQRLKVETNEANKAAREQAKNVKIQAGSLNDLRRRLKETRKEFDNLNLSEEKNQKRAKQLTKEINTLDAQVRKLETSTGRAQRNVGNYGSAFKGAAASMRNFAGALGVVTGISLVTRTIRDAFNVIRDFDKAQANLAAISGLTAEELAPLTQQAKDLGATTAFTAGQVSELQLELAKLGFSPQQIQDSTGAILNLSAALNADLGEAAALTGSALNAFGLEASEAGRVTDVLVKGANSAALDFSFFNTALSNVAPTAASLGVSIEETTALLGTLANSGVDASTASTGLRNIFLELTKSGLSLPEALDMIQNSSDQAATALDLFGKRGASLGVILANNQDATAGLEQTLLNAGGTAEEVANKQLDSLDGQLKILRSAWEGYILGADGASGASNFLKNVVSFLAENLNTILNAIVGITAAFTAYKTATFAVRAATQAWTAVQWLLNVALTANPIGILIVAIAAITAAIIIFRKEIGETLGVLGDAFNSTEDLAKAIEKLFDLFGGLNTLLGDITSNQKKYNAEVERQNKINNEAIEAGRELLKQSSERISRAQILIDAIINENTATEDKQKAIEELNKTYPELIGNIDLETASTEKLLAIKQQLVTQILRENAEKRKAAVIDQFANRILDLQIQLLQQTTQAGRDAIQKSIDELTASIPLIEDIANTVIDNIEENVGNLDLSQPFRETDAEITELKRKIEIAQKELDAALEAGNQKRADAARRNIKDLEKELLALEKLQKDRLGFGLEGTPQAEEEGTGTGTGGKTGKKSVIDIEKENLAKIEQLRKDNATLLLALENSLIKAGVDRAEIDARLLDQRIRLYRQELAFIKDIVGEESDVFIKAQNDLFDFLEQNQTQRIERDIELIEQGNDVTLERQETFYDEFARQANEANKKQEEERKKAVAQLKKQAQEIIQTLEVVTEAIEKNIDRRIDAQQKEIDQRRDRVDDLKKLAAEGNLDASESIKAEEKRISEAQLEIERLERKKRNLLVITVGLQALSNALEAGDNNAFQNTNSNLKKFFSDLPTFYSGTKGTVKEALGAADFSGKDGYIIRADGQEKILNPELSRMTGNASTSEIVNGFLANQNDRSIMSRPKLMAASLGASNAEVLAEQRKTNKLLEDLPNNMPIYQQDYDVLRGIVKDTVKIGNRTENNFNSIRGRIS